MTFLKRHRGLIIVGTLLTLAIGSEVALELYYQGVVVVQVENLGSEPIENLVLIHGSERVIVRKIDPGAVSRLFLSGNRHETLRLEFRQRGNGMTSYDLPGFDASDLYREGAKLRLQFRPNEIERFQEEAEPVTPLGRFASSLWKRLKDRLETEYRPIGGPP